MGRGRAVGILGASALAAALPVAAWGQETPPRPVRPAPAEAQVARPVQVSVKVWTPAGEEIPATVSCRPGEPLCEGWVAVGGQRYQIWYPAPARERRLSAGKWLEALAKPGPEGPIIYCPREGWGCLVAALASARNLTPVHDSTLAEATARINRLLDEVRAKGGEGPDKTLCFYQSGSGPLLIWTRRGTLRRAERASLVSDPPRIDEMLGVTRRVNAERLLRFVNDVPSPPGLGAYWDCRSPGAGCEVGGFATASERTPAHDEVLAAATEEINRILSEYTRKEEVRVEGRTEVAVFRPCIVTTAAGLFLAWTRVE